MGEIEEFEQRIVAALERIGQAIDRAIPTDPGQGADAPGPDAETARPAEPDSAELRATVGRLTAQLDAQGLDLQRTRKTMMQLREQLRALRQAQAQGAADPALVDQAMAVELDALRVSRLSEIAEMDEILSELKPLIAEAQHA